MILLGGLELGELDFLLVMASVCWKMARYRPGRHGLIWDIIYETSIFNDDVHRRDGLRKKARMEEDF